MKFLQTINNGLNRASLKNRLLKFWGDLNGDTAYACYLAHWHSHHANNEDKPLSRKAFFAAETQRKWNGIKRCC
jgi:uncharacterized short protein YbdD (DUF466 family)